MTATQYFLSHASPDKPLVRQLGVQLQLVGAEVFFDEWNIAAGESITGAIEHALDRYDGFLLVWSASARDSLWTKREYQAAVKLFVEDPDRRLIVLRVDDTAVPALVNDLKWVDLQDEGDIAGAVEQVMGFRGAADRIKAIQRFLEASDIQVEYVPGYGAIVGCPKCGAGLDQIRPWHQIDHQRDDTYAGARCLACAWEDGGEVI
jgi:hypothetical protein